MVLCHWSVKTDQQRKSGCSKPGVSGSVFEPMSSDHMRMHSHGQPSCISPLSPSPCVCLRSVSTDELQKVIDAVQQQEAAGGIEPLHEDDTPTSILETEPVPGQIVDRREYPILGATELKLSNGMRVGSSDCQDVTRLNVHVTVPLFARACMLERVPWPQHMVSLSVCACVCMPSSPCLLPQLLTPPPLPSLPHNLNPLHPNTYQPPSAPTPPHPPLIVHPSPTSAHLPCMHSVSSLLCAGLL